MDGSKLECWSIKDNGDGTIVVRILHGFFERNVEFQAYSLTEIKEIS